MGGIWRMLKHSNLNKKKLWNSLSRQIDVMQNPHIGETSDIFVYFHKAFHDATYSHFILKNVLFLHKKGRDLINLFTYFQWM